MRGIALGRLGFRHHKVLGRGTKVSSQDKNSNRRRLDTNPLESAGEHEHAL